MREDYEDRTPRTLPPEDGHDRAARRETNWYRNPDEKKAGTNLRKDALK